MGLTEEQRHLEDLDREYIWHPFTQMKEWREEVPIIIAEGNGCFIKDIYGRWYLDGVSSLWVNIFGHRRKEIDDAIREQLDRIAHSTLLGLSNVPATRLAEKLVRLAQDRLHPQSDIREADRTGEDVGDFSGASPRGDEGRAGATGGLRKVFYSDNGSTAVEVGLKMAFQYWKLKGVGGKNTFVSLTHAYHGDTIGAVSVGGIDIFHRTFEPLLFRTYKAPSPYCYRCELGKTYPQCALACLEKMERVVSRHREEIAGLIIEPLIQAAGGMIVSPPGYLRGVRDVCTRYGILMIADEVATGFGRTGKMFACEHEKVVPDILCLSKGITGGYLPLAVTLATEEIYRAFLAEYRELKTFFHGHSYTGNPLACAAALACLDLFERDGVLEKLETKVALLESSLRDIGTLPHVGDVRNAGLMAGIELVQDKNAKTPFAWEEKMGWKVAYRARERGVFIRPLGNVIVVMPPLVIGERNLARMMSVISESIVWATTG